MTEQTNADPMTKYNGIPDPSGNFVMMPTIIFEDMLPDLHGAPAIVLLYLARHTWGFQEFNKAKRITLDEFMNGRKRRDGSRMDRGTGLGRETVVTAIKKLVELGLIEVIEDNSDAARKARYYAIRIAPRNADKSALHGELSEIGKSDLETPSGVGKSDLIHSRIRPRTEIYTSKKETLEEIHSSTATVRSRPLTGRSKTPPPVLNKNLLPDSAKDNVQYTDFELMIMQSRGAKKLTPRQYELLNSKHTVVPVDRPKIEIESANALWLTDPVYQLYVRQTIDFAQHRRLSVSWIVDRVVNFRNFYLVMYDKLALQAGSISSQTDEIPRIDLSKRL